jgi:hypothetical protein
MEKLLPFKFWSRCDNVFCFLHKFVAEIKSLLTLAKMGKITFAKEFVKIIKE